jgi:hypothetical protein
MSIEKRMSESAGRWPRDPNAPRTSAEEWATLKDNVATLRVAVMGLTHANESLTRERNACMAKLVEQGIHVKLGKLGVSFER